MKNAGVPKFEILDCTVRDGGYLNNWDFDKKMVKEIYRNISRTGVDFIEIGFRNSPESGRGIWHSTFESLINEFSADISGCAIALMMDCGKANISSMPDAKDSKVKMYRIASHRDEILSAIDLCEKIKKKGYITSIQLMGIAGFSRGDLSSIIKPLAESSIDYIYFADSYGSLFPQDIKKYIKILKPTNKKIGFHPHNSLQLAFANALEAINNGINIIDGTVYGMGRGAGNLPLEALILYLEKTLSNEKYNAIPILDLIDRYFIDLARELRWGYGLPYLLSGIFEVHPTYAKTLVEYKEYNIHDMVKILEVIKDLKPLGYKKNILDKVISDGFRSSRNTLEDDKYDTDELSAILSKYPVAYRNRHANRDFLVLANGPTLSEYKKDIDKFIQLYKPVIMGANYLGGLFKPDYHAFSNKKRFINYVDQVHKNSVLLLSNSFEENFIKEYSKRDYEWIVHLNRYSNSFAIKDGVITSNCRTVSILLIAVAIVMGARRIFITGMDGYKNKEDLLPKHLHFYNESQETEDFKLLIEKHDLNEMLLNSINGSLVSQNKEGLHIITPTSHNYFYNSIYNWIK